MKRCIRIGSILCAAVILSWYCIPSVYQALHAPNCIENDLARSVPALQISEADVKDVRSGEDERISQYRETEQTMKLFGLIPLRTFYEPVARRTVMIGGEAVGIVLKTNGVQIVGLGEIETASGSKSPATDAGLQAGDMVLAVNGTTVADTASFMNLCSLSVHGCSLLCMRGSETFTTVITPERDRDGVLRIGALVRDSTSGIGTLSFYDANSGNYAALGHGVTDVDTGKLISPATGYLTKAVITGVRKGYGEKAGELIGTFSVHESDAIASVLQNTEFGISGSLSTLAQKSEQQMAIASTDAAHLGDALIYTTADGDAVHVYRARIIRIDVQSAPSIQGMMIEITDPALLERTGGIVQGMSGSPLIQDGRLIGVVTHVFVSHPTRGYCLYAAWMAEKLLPST